MGKARWRDRVILDGRVRRFGPGRRVWRPPKKTNLEGNCSESEDEGKSSCEKMQVVLGVLLVVAVCQNTPSGNPPTPLGSSGVWDPCLFLLPLLLSSPWPPGNCTGPLAPPRAGTLALARAPFCDSGETLETLGDSLGPPTRPPQEMESRKCTGLEREPFPTMRNAIFPRESVMSESHVFRDFR